MKTTFFLIAVVLCLQLCAQSEEDLVRETLNKYLEGSSYSDPEMIQSAFYVEADLFLSKEGQELWVLTPKEYSALFEVRPKGKFNGRETTILSIDLHHNIATATAEIRITSRNMRFIDIFLLKKLSGEWKIISKAATLMPNGE
ncbi:nuclear transport factor 2 family protein [Flagellimonas meishanensis]|uniref:nuclear transport factor 2 family protein n=1 Tax=Flagellimonas meishanensis TaxID=2873264 RepID=UPI001CA6739A|nr:nuclear transport factor 2 family protein [[Muricauda] meishanensis]